MLYSDNAQTSNYLLRLKILALVLVATVLIDRSHLPLPLITQFFEIVIIYDNTNEKRSQQDN